MITYGLILPVYWSHKALTQNDTKELKKWLAHWVIYAIFMQALYVTNICFGAWFPFYNEIVLISFLWLIFPHFNGGMLLYEDHLKPFLTEHEPAIDSSMKSAGKKVLQFGMQLGLTLLEEAKGYLILFLKKYGDEISNACNQINVVLTSEASMESNGASTIGDGLGINDGASKEDVDQLSIHPEGGFKKEDHEEFLKNIYISQLKRNNELVKEPKTKNKANSKKDNLQKYCDAKIKANKAQFLP